MEMIRQTQSVQAPKDIQVKQRLGNKETSPIHDKIKEEKFRQHEQLG